MMTTKPKTNKIQVTEQELEEILANSDRDGGFLKLKGFYSLTIEQCQFISNIILSKQYNGFYQIDLSHTLISPTGLNILLQAILLSKQKLEVLLLKQNELIHESSLTIAKLLTDTIILKYLDLSENLLRDTGLGNIGQCFGSIIDWTIFSDHNFTMSLATLIILDLSNNDFGDMGLLSLCRGLHQFTSHLSVFNRQPSLKVLNLNGNKIGDKGVICLAQLINKKVSNENEIHLPLMELDLSDNLIGTKGMNELLGSVEFHSITPLKYLKLSRCKPSLHVLNNLAHLIENYSLDLEYLELDFTNDSANDIVIESSTTAICLDYDQKQPPQSSSTSSSLLSAAQVIKRLVSSIFTKQQDYYPYNDRKSGIHPGTNLKRINLGKLPQVIFEQCVWSEKNDLAIQYKDMFDALQRMNSAADLFGIPLVSNVRAWTIGKLYHDATYFIKLPPPPPGRYIFVPHQKIMKERKKIQQQIVREEIPSDSIAQVSADVGSEFDERQCYDLLSDRINSSWVKSEPISSFQSTFQPSTLSNAFNPVNQLSSGSIRQTDLSRNNLMFNFKDQQINQLRENHESAFSELASEINHLVSATSPPMKTSIITAKKVDQFRNFETKNHVQHIVQDTVSKVIQHMESPNRQSFVSLPSFQTQQQPAITSVENYPIELSPTRVTSQKSNSLGKGPVIDANHLLRSQHEKAFRELVEEIYRVTYGADYDPSRFDGSDPAMTKIVDETVAKLMEQTTQINPVILLSNLSKNYNLPFGDKKLIREFNDEQLLLSKTNFSMLNGVFEQNGVNPVSTSKPQLRNHQRGSAQHHPHNERSRTFLTANDISQQSYLHTPFSNSIHDYSPSNNGFSSNLKQPLRNNQSTLRQGFIDEMKLDNSTSHVSKVKPADSLDQPKFATSNGTTKEKPQFQVEPSKPLPVLHLSESAPTLNLIQETIHDITQRIKSKMGNNSFSKTSYNHSMKAVETLIQPESASYNAINHKEPTNIRLERVLNRNAEIQSTPAPHMSLRHQIRNEKEEAKKEFHSPILAIESVENRIHSFERKHRNDLRLELITKLERATVSKEVQDMLLARLQEYHISNEDDFQWVNRVLELLEDYETIQQLEIGKGSIDDRNVKIDSLHDVQSDRDKNSYLKIHEKKASSLHRSNEGFGKRMKPKDRLNSVENSRTTSNKRVEKPDETDHAIFGDENGEAYLVEDEIGYPDFDVSNVNAQHFHADMEELIDIDNDSLDDNHAKSFQTISHRITGSYLTGDSSDDKPTKRFQSNNSIVHNHIDSNFHDKYSRKKAISGKDLHKTEKYPVENDTVIYKNYTTKALINSRKYGYQIDGKNKTIPTPTSPMLIKTTPPYREISYESLAKTTDFYRFANELVQDLHNYN